LGVAFHHTASVYSVELTTWRQTDVKYMKLENLQSHALMSNGIVHTCMSSVHWYCSHSVNKLMFGFWTRLL